MNASTLFMRVDRAERRLCLLANSAVRRAMVRTLFRVVSRLGDGVFWYVVIAAMPLILGTIGFLVAAQMLATGAVGLMTYKFLKGRLVRERPYISLAGIDCAMAPLDRYSFPSGHTLHATSFTIMALHHVPELAPLLVPFAIAVAASRVILGLHYPTDVAVGACIGAAIAAGSNALIS